ncbi:MAG: methyl-accepting chemotaxis protein, partial [Rhodocyclaceae bacterium]|nr:methyl-accepting chemotaxis protein [Rhodocyclaceae bacterium]
RDFLEVSGYTEAELIGEPHNLVRHPDMPPEAFQDLWDTLNAARPWTGYVKNRAKNGDFYWVLANATPLWGKGETKGQITGYLSIRRKPSRDMVAAHEAVYRQFREKKQGNLKIRHGQAVTGSGWQDKVTLAQRLGGFVGAIGLLVVIAALLSVVILSKTNDAAVSLYGQRAEGVRILGKITQAMAEDRTQIAMSGLGIHHDPTVAHADHRIYMVQVRKNVTEAAELWNAYQKTIRSEEHRRLAEDYASLRERFVREGLDPAIAAIEKSDNGTAWGLFQEKINPLYLQSAAKAEVLRERHVRLGETEMNASQTRFTMTRNTQVIALFFLLILGAYLSARIIRTLRTDLRNVVTVLRNIAQGDYSNVIAINRDDEIGKLNQALQAMQTSSGFEVSETRREATEMTRIKVGLYSSTAAITISDAQGVLMHATPAAESLLKTVSGRTLTDLIGKKLTETVLTDPNDQSALNDAALHGHDIDIMLNNRHLRLSARPILDAQGQPLGRVTTWIDRSTEAVMEREIDEIVQAAAMGDYSARLSLEGKSGFFAGLAEGINEVLETTANALSTTIEVLGRMAKGDLTRTVEGEYSGIFGQLKDDTNTTVGRLREVVGRIKEASEAINIAAQEIAAGNQDLSARTEEQASSLEETASSMEELNATVRNNADNSRQANELAKNSNDIAVKGGAMVKEVIVTMGEIQTSSKKIADIITVIDSIAFQTNILALNAAVEAARAGEQGRGFAVVASEVRNLAQRSATAAKEIKTLIAESVDKVESGTKLVGNAGRTMDEVVTSFEKVTHLVTGISDASREQSSGIDQVTKAVTQMDEVTQQNAALVEEAAAAAESLEEQARSLVQSVGMFKLAEEKASSHLPAPALRDATPKRLMKAAPKSLNTANGNSDEWAEF